MSGILWMPPTKEQIEMEEEIKRLLADAKPMTAADHYAQRRSWVRGEMGIEHPDWSEEKLDQIVDDALSSMGYVKP